MFTPYCECAKNHWCPLKRGQNGEILYYVNFTSKKRKKDTCKINVGDLWKEPIKYPYSGNEKYGGECNRKAEEHKRQS